MKSSGNILFLILIAIALFAALLYAVVGSSRSNLNTAKPEKLNLAASDLLNWFSSIDSAFLRMRMSGIAAEDINWENSVWQRVNNNPLITDNSGFNALGTACSEDRCKIFLPNSGGVYPKILAPELLPPFTPTGTAAKLGHAYIAPASSGGNTLAISGLGTSAGEYTIIFPSVGLDFCMVLNKAVGVSNRADDCPPTTTTFWNSDIGSSSAPPISGSSTFCILASAPSQTTDCRDPTVIKSFYIVHSVMDK